MPIKSKVSKSRKASSSSIGTLRFSNSNNHTNNAASPKETMSSFAVAHTTPLKGPPNFPPTPYPPGLGKFVNGRWLPVPAPRSGKASSTKPGVRPVPAPRKKTAPKPPARRSNITRKSSRNSNK